MVLINLSIRYSRHTMSAAGRRIASDKLACRALDASWSVGDTRADRRCVIIARFARAATRIDDKLKAIFCALGRQRRQQRKRRRRCGARAVKSRRRHVWPLSGPLDRHACRRAHFYDTQPRVDRLYDAHLASRRRRRPSAACRRRWRTWSAAAATMTHVAAAAAATRDGGASLKRRLLRAKERAHKRRHFISSSDARGHRESDRRLLARHDSASDSRAHGVRSVSAFARARARSGGGDERAPADSRRLPDSASISHWRARARLSSMCPLMCFAHVKPAATPRV